MLFWKNEYLINECSITQICGLFACLMTVPPLINGLPFVISKGRYFGDEKKQHYRWIYLMHSLIDAFTCSIIQLIGIIVITNNGASNNKIDFILIISLEISIVNVCINLISIGYYHLTDHYFISSKVFLVLCWIMDYFGIILTLLLLFDNPSVDTFKKYAQKIHNTMIYTYC